MWLCVEWSTGLSSHIHVCTSYTHTHTCTHTLTLHTHAHPIHAHRPAICIFYLVLRALDTVEDDMTISVQEKVPMLKQFHTFLYAPQWNYMNSKEKDKAVLEDFPTVKGKGGDLIGQSACVCHVPRLALCTHVLVWLMCTMDTHPHTPHHTHITHHTPHTPHIHTAHPHTTPHTTPHAHHTPHTYHNTHRPPTPISCIKWDACTHTHHHHQWDMIVSHTHAYNTHITHTCTQHTSHTHAHNTHTHTHTQISAEFRALKQKYQEVISDITCKMGNGMCVFLQDEVVTMAQWDEVRVGRCWGKRAGR